MSVFHVDTIMLGIAGELTGVEVSLDSETGVFSAYLDDQLYQHAQLRKLVEMLKTAHRKLNADVKWIKAIRVAPKQGVVNAVYIAKIGRAIFINAKPERDGHEYALILLALNDRKKSPTFPMVHTIGYEGDIYLFEYTDRIMEDLSVIKGKLDAIRDKWTVEYDKFRSTVESLYQEAREQ
jgi:hypothetical protein